MFLRITAILLSLAIMMQGQALAAAPAQTYNWIKGGKSVKLGNIATLDLGPDFLFLNDTDTKKMLKETNNSVYGNELGSVYPADENQDWVVYFEYDDSGHIKDAEKEKIDAKAILKSYKEGTEEHNKTLSEADQIHVVGWDVEPFYDSQTHNLSWSMLAEYSDKTKLINYNVRLLTRTGYVSVILASDPDHLNEDKQILISKILPKFAPVEGQRYQDYDASKDKTSEYGLSALILGGAGLAVAKKAGLLALAAVFLKKGWIVILALIGIIFGGVKRLMGRKNKAAPQQTPAEPPQDPQQPSV
ncbi:DUF2167 domain-containing protein [Paenibacillus sp. y28]|uniref:DUF2167 domain-containing protein n=1 Tax=Paenibacillus sp. y28 TaxID=3129110 RepID=UPI0030164F8F